MSAITQLKEMLRQQKNLLNTYIARKKGAAAKKNKYQKRIRELEAIKRDINRKLDGCADDVRGQQKKMSGKLGSAVRKHAHTGELVDAIAAGYEKSADSDSSCAQMVSEIDSEISRCRGELESAENEYNQANRNVNTTNENIKNINKKIQEESAKKAKAGK